MGDNWRWRFLAGCAFFNLAITDFCDAIELQAAGNTVGSFVNGVFVAVYATLVFVAAVPPFVRAMDEASDGER